MARIRDRGREHKNARWQARYREPSGRQGAHSGLLPFFGHMGYFVRAQTSLRAGTDNDPNLVRAVQRRSPHRRKLRVA